MADPCDCRGVPFPAKFECTNINSLARAAGPDSCPPSTPVAPSAFVVPQPLKIELIERCDIEDPDLRPYVWDCKV